MAMTKFNKCPKCDMILIQQIGWIDDKSISNEICVKCGNIDAGPWPLDVIKEIEKKRDGSII